MKRYIAYFDFLGFKKFILNNDSEYIRKRIGDILQDIESAIGQEKTTYTNYGIVANLNNSKINCLNISDTVIFWTNEDSFDSFNELLKISFKFNWLENCYNFPVRGAIVYDEIDIIHGYQKTEKGGTYNVNSIYGKGLVTAHLKAEDLNLASCVIDTSVIEKIQEFGNVEDILGGFAMKYKVPYKNRKGITPEYVLKFFINKTINQVVFKTRSKAIENAFNNDNKGMNKRVEILLKNTIDFLEAMKKKYSYQIRQRKFLMKMKKSINNLLMFRR